MSPSRVAGLLLCALAAPCESARFSHVKAHADLAVVDMELMKTGVWLTETCQDYPEELGFGLGDTVRITSENNRVGLVGCQNPDQPGLVCLEGLKGCFPVEQLAHTNTLLFALHTIGGAAKQIFSAIADDVKEQWRDVKFTLFSFASSVSARISAGAEDLADACNICKEDDRKQSELEFNVTLVKTKSRFSMLVDSASERWADAKEGIASVAEATVANLVKLGKYLAKVTGDAYDKYLKEIVDALAEYLGGIARAVANVPGRKASTEVVEDPVPSRLELAIESFTEKIGELNAKLMSMGKSVYDSAAWAIGAVQAGTGRLIAALSDRWSSIKQAVRRMATAAYEQVKEWSSKALTFACNFSVKKTATDIFQAVQDKFKQAVDAVVRGYKYVKESLKAVADSITSTLAAVARNIKETAVALWESETVQNALAAIKEEIRVLKELIVEQAGLVQKFLGGFLGYFGRFVPSWLKSKLKTAGEKARELALKIKADIAELMNSATDGEAEDIEVDDTTVVEE